MPAYSAQLDLSSVKWVAGDELNRSRGLPYISGLILLSEGASGLPVAIIEAGAITAARTAAVSAAAVDALAAPGWSRVALIGHGRQARAHVRALRSLNPDAAFRVASRRPPGPEPGIEPAASPRESVFRSLSVCRM